MRSSSPPSAEGLDHETDVRGSPASGDKAAQTDNTVGPSGTWAGVAVGLFAVAALFVGGPRSPTTPHPPNVSAETLQIEVTAAGGTPLADVVVWRTVDPETGSHQLQPERLGATDVAGRLLLAPSALFPTDPSSRAPMSWPAGATRVLEFSAPGYGRQRVHLAGPGTLHVELEDAASLAGRVHDEDGQGIAATVALWPATHHAPMNGGAEARSMTAADVTGAPPLHVLHADEAGHFESDEVAAGPVHVRVSAAGYATETFLVGAPIDRQDDGASPPPSLRDDLRVRLLRAGIIAGQLNDPEGHPTTATVVLSGSGIWPPRTYSSDENGRFRIADVPPGIYEIWGRGEEDGVLTRSPTVADIQVEAGTSTFVPLHLTVADQLEGHVVRSDGTPIANAEVVLASAGQISPPRTHTDETGHFQFITLTQDANAQERGREQGDAANATLTSSSPLLLVQAPSFLPAEHRVLPGGGPIRITMTQGATFRGLVTDHLGHPVAGARVQWLTRSRTRAPVIATSHNLGVTTGPVPPIPFGDTPAAAVAFGSTTSGADGRFELTGIHPGAGALRAVHDDHAPSHLLRTTATAGVTTDSQHLSLRAGGRIFGRVIDERGFPIAHVPVDISADPSVGASDSTEEWVASRDMMGALTGPDGTFSFGGVLGAVTLTARPLGVTPYRQTVFIAAGERRDIDLVVAGHLHGLRGRVVDPRGFGVDGVSIHLAGAEASGETRAPFEQDTFTESDGTFAFAGLPAPPYRLSLRHREYADGVREIEADYDGSLFSVSLAYGADIYGVVQDEWTGAPAAGVTVVAQGPDHAERVTDGLGAYRMERMPAGNYRITATLDGREVEGSAAVEATPFGAESVEVAVLSLPAAGTLSVEVVDALGQGAPSATVLIDDEETGTTDRSGRWQGVGLRPGLHHIQAVHPEAGATGGERFRVVPTEQSQVRLVLPGRLPLSTEVPVESEGESDAAETPTDEAPTESYEGVAIRVGRQGGRVTVLAVVAGSHAARAGLRPGDELVEIDGEPVLAAATARAALRGSSGRARIAFRRGRRTFRRFVRRERFSLPRP